jgi:hypothetical protein
MRAYGVVSDIFYEYMRMSETTCTDSMHKFRGTVIAVFGDVYLREPNIADIARLLSIIEARSFLGCLEA